MDDLSPGAWMLTLLVLVIVAWAVFLAWSSGVLNRWLQAWGLRGVRAFAAPKDRVASPEVHRQPHAGHAPRHVGGTTGRDPVAPHRSGQRKSKRR